MIGRCATALRHLTFLSFYFGVVLSLVGRPSKRPSYAFQRTISLPFIKRLSRIQSETLAAKTASTAVIEYDDFLPTPNPDLDAHGVVTTCMKTLLEGKEGAGLEVCFAFSSDRCRAALGGSLELFRQYANNPVFGYLINCLEWETLSVGPIINGTATRGAMQTVLMAAKDGQNQSQTFLWTLQQERRPPLHGCWIIHEVLYVKNAYARTL